MKRLLFVLLCFVLIVSVTASIAFASANAEGYYNGYRYRANLNRMSKSVSASMTYQGNSTIQLSGTYTYQLPNGQTTTKGLSASGTYSIADYKSISSGTMISSFCNYYVGPVFVTSLSD